MGIQNLVGRSRGNGFIVENTSAVTADDANLTRARPTHVSGDAVRRPYPYSEQRGSLLERGASLGSDTVAHWAEAQLGPKLKIHSWLLCSRVDREEVAQATTHGPWGVFFYQGPLEVTRTALHRGSKGAAPAFGGGRCLPRPSSSAKETNVVVWVSRSSGATTVPGRPPTPKVLERTGRPKGSARGASKMAHP